MDRQALELEILNEHVARVGIVVDDENRIGERERIHETFSDPVSPATVAVAGCGPGTAAPPVIRAEVPSALRYRNLISTTVANPRSHTVRSRSHDRCTCVRVDPPSCRDTPRAGE
jgi:hypothetical protein